MGRVGLIFPGQGAQYPGMGLELYKNEIAAKNVFDEADNILGFKISELCFQGSSEELAKTVNTQIAVFTANMAVCRVLMEKGIKADITAGLSLGEYCALVLSGVFSFKDALLLVKKRAEYMQSVVEHLDGGMAAVLGLQFDEVEELCKEARKYGNISIANLNCPGQIVIAGENKALEFVCIRIGEMGKRAIKLNVNGPFHTELLKEAAERLYNEITKVDAGTPAIPIVANLTGDYINPNTDIADLMKLQVMSCVRWEDSIRRMINDGTGVFVEAGPGKVLSGFLRKIDRNVKVFNVENCDSLNKTLEFFGGQL